MKAKLKKILVICTWVLLVGGLLAALGFVNKEQARMRCKAPEITISRDSSENNFVEREDIIKLLNDRGDSIDGQPMSSVNVSELENVLNSHVAISKAEVYMSVDGEVSIEVSQRKPVIRVFNWNNESYYIDEEGKLMPLSEKFTARVPIASGYITEPYARRYMYTIQDIENDSLARTNSVLDDLYKLAMFINKDEFWKAQVGQIYVNKDGELEIIPLVGDHRIVLGDATELEGKFKKLRVFYEEGLNTTGWWNKYSVINLKFKDQVVCTKKQ
jgi:cell division protein FtsQ